jgi:hypothetical protein
MAGVEKGEAGKRSAWVKQAQDKIREIARNQYRRVVTNRRRKRSGK